MPEKNPYSFTTQYDQWVEWETKNAGAGAAPAATTTPAAAPSKPAASAPTGTTYQPGAPKSSGGGTPYPTTLERNLAAQQQQGWPQFATKEQLQQQGFVPFGNDNRYVSKDGRTYSLTNTGMFQVGYSATSSADRQALSNMISQGAFSGAQAGPTTAQAPASAPTTTPAQRGTSAGFYDAVKSTGAIPDPATIGRVGAVFDRSQGRIPYAPDGYRLYTPNLRVDNSIRSRGGQPRVADSLYNSTTLMVPDAYKPSNAFAPGEGLITGGLASSYDFNGAGAGGDSYMVPTGYQTAELRGGTAGGWGINSNSILSDFGYQPSGDPVADAAKAFEIRQAMEQSGLTGQAALDAYGPQQVDPTSLDTGQSAYFQAGAGPDETVTRTDSGYIFSGAAKGASMKMSDPFAIVNLRTGNRIIGSEYGQDEMLHVNDNRIAVQPMGKPMSDLPNVTSMMAADGAQVDTQQYYDDGTPVNGGVARQSQVNWANAIAPTASQPTGMSVADRERQNAIAYSDSQGYQPTRTITWAQTNEQQPPSVGRMGGSTFAEANRMQTLDNARRGLDANGWPLGTQFPGGSNGGTGTPGGTPGGGGGGEVPGGETPGGGTPGGGGWPGGGGPGGGAQNPGPELEDSIRRARDQRLRDMYAYQYAIAGLPNQQALDVNQMPGVNAPTGFYWNTPDWSGAIMDAQNQLATLGQTGNSQALRSQIADLQASLTGGAGDAAIRAQIDGLQQQLSRAVQADNLRNSIGNMRGQIDMNGLPPTTPGNQLGPNDTVGPMPGERPSDMLPQANTPMPNAPDFSHSEVNWMSKRAPREIGELLKLDYQLTNYGDVNSNSITQTEEAIQNIADENTRVRAEDMLRRIVMRMNAPRGNVPPLDVSPPPEDPIAMLAMSKFGR